MSNSIILKSQVFALFSLAFLSLMPINAMASGFNVLEIQLVEQLHARIIDNVVFAPLQERVGDSYGQWTKIVASDEEALRGALGKLDANQRFSHLIINSHGGSFPESVFLSTGGRLLFFMKGSPVEKNPFAALRGRFTDNPKVFLGGCEVFSGSENDAEYKAHLFADALALDEVEIFGSKQYHSPMLNLMPPLRWSGFSQQLLRHALFSMFSYSVMGLINGLFDSDSPVGVAPYSFVIGVCFSTTLSVLARLLPTSLYGHSGYVVNLSKEGNRVALASTDLYLNRHFLSL